VPATVERSNGKATQEPITGRRGRVTIAPLNSPPAEALARLQRLVADPLAAPGETLKTAGAAPILLNEKDMTFGTDPVQSYYVLDDPSLAPRHARITQTEDGQFVVADAGTIAGTWVNFEPLGKESHPLQHGDVVHFGQLMYRFELKDPPPPTEPEITKENA
jgi:pSer/pThr/pTyr-binding forkhead associated (FHA) protein